MNNLVENNFMPLVENFLGTLTAGQIRQSISDIDDSYNHDWDILAELLQNSVDAIRKKGNNEGFIKILVDCQNRNITVQDNGVGINCEKLPKLISMFGTDKRDDEASIGEKGVGLKFAIFSCNDFYLKTGNTSGSSYARVKDANSWKRATQEDDFINLDTDPLDEGIEGTIVELKKIGEEHLIFELTFEQLKYVLRTKTAIGNTNELWNVPDFSINVTLTYIDPTGKIDTETLPFKYWLPIEGLPKNDILSLKEYEDWLMDGSDKNDAQKRNKLKNKIIYWEKYFNIGNRDIKSFCCAVPSRSMWEKLNTAFKLATIEQLEDGEWIDKYGYSLFQPGIFMSVKGMPTGITIEQPTTGAAGSWAQIFLLFEDRKLKFDIGRKSIHGKTKNIYKERARIIFNDYRNKISKYVSGIVSPEASSWDRDEIFDEISKLIDLKSNLTKFQKTPKDQEAAVSALFFEAIGSGLIKEIKPLTSSYKSRYDLYAFWGSKRVVIEFKSTLYKVLKDFVDTTKMFQEINCIVCWDVSEDDEQFFKDEGIALEIIEPDGIINTNLKKFPSATHTLRLSGFMEPIYVIDMKIILKA